MVNIVIHDPLLVQNEEDYPSPTIFVKLVPTSIRDSENVGVKLVLCNGRGEAIGSSNILAIGIDGKLELFSAVNRRSNLDLDQNGKINIRRR